MTRIAWSSTFFMASILEIHIHCKARTIAITHRKKYISQSPLHIGRFTKTRAYYCGSMTDDGQRLWSSMNAERRQKRVDQGWNYSLWYIEVMEKGRRWVV